MNPHILIQNLIICVGLLWSPPGAYGWIARSERQAQGYRELKTPTICPGSVTKVFFQSSLGLALVFPRGGYSPSITDEEDEVSDNEDDEEVEESRVAVADQKETKELMEEILVVSQNAFKSTFQMIKRAAGVTARALGRSLRAGLDEPEKESELPALYRIGKAVRRMLLALLEDSPSPRVGESSAAPCVEIVDEESDYEDEEDIPQLKEAADYGTYLEKAYKVQGSRNSLDGPCAIHTGSFADALVSARSQARLLLVLIPSKKPSSKNSAADEEALKSFLSQNVSAMADRRARKQGAENLGSFFLWSALPGSPEAINAMKRLQLSATNTKGLKRPIVAAVYAGQAVDAYGRPKILPKLLAQHHASPPPAADMMAAWMNALRKRHAAQYAKMQKEIAELELWKERKHGYKSSMQADAENRKREEREAAEAKAREAAEKKRKQQIIERRSKLKDSLPEEPKKETPGVKTIALRMPDGQSAQRRFLPDTSIEDIFNWVDVTFEIEREVAVLTTLNGRSKFSWGEHPDATLTEVGLSKMTAFRVTQDGDPDATKPNGNGAKHE